jgi:hypothetical protein
MNALNQIASSQFLGISTAGLALIVSCCSLGATIFNLIKQYSKRYVLLLNVTNVRQTGPLDFNIALSNFGNTEVLLIGIEYHFPSSKEVWNGSGFYPHNHEDMKLPCLIKPGDIQMIAIKSDMDLENTPYNIHQFGTDSKYYLVFLKIHTICANGKKQESLMPIYKLSFGGSPGVKYQTTSIRNKKDKNIFNEDACQEKDFY